MSEIRASDPRLAIGIAEQQENPNANSEAAIANREAVVDLIEQHRQAAGCE